MFRLPWNSLQLELQHYILSAGTQRLSFYVSREELSAGDHARNFVSSERFNAAPLLRDTQITRQTKRLSRSGDSILCPVAYLLFYIFFSTAAL
jgi:hypothetical protein